MGRRTRKKTGERKKGSSSKKGLPRTGEVHFGMKYSKGEDETKAYGGRNPKHFSGEWKNRWGPSTPGLERERGVISIKTVRNRNVNWRIRGSTTREEITGKASRGEKSLESLKSLSTHVSLTSRNEGCPLGREEKRERRSIQKKSRSEEGEGKGGSTMAAYRSPQLWA